MSEFSPGFAVRHKAPADILKRALSAADDAFAPRDIVVRSGGRSDGDGRPRSYAPADPAAPTRPTEGWDPMDANAQPSGFLDPVAAAHAAGFAEGLAAARAEMLKAEDGARSLGDAVAQALADGGFVDRDRLASRLRQTVMMLVARMVGEAGVDADRLEARVRAAADLIADTTENAVLRLHPDTVPLVDGRLPANLIAVADATLAPGAFVIESSSTIVEDGPEQWLEQLAQAIDRVALPPSC